MQTVSIFQNSLAPNQVGGSREVRLARGVQRLALLASKGASKVNPVAAVIDAGLSLLDAGQSYLRYSAAKQESRALEAQLAALRHQLYNDLEILQIERQKREQDRQSFFEALELQLRENRSQAQQVQKNLRRYRNVSESLLKQLELARYQQPTHLQEFVCLEAAAHRAMRAYLSYFVNSQA